MFFFSFFPLYFWANVFYYASKIPNDYITSSKYLFYHEQVCLMRLRFERHFFHQYADLLKFIISRNVATLNILDHDVITLLYCEH